MHTNQISSSQPEENTQFSDVISILKKYNFDDIFLWLQVTSAHPSNQKYFIRINLMNTLLLSIPSDQFKGTAFLRNDCENLFNCLCENYSSYFVPVEDYTPFDQLKLIPYFYEKRKYYFYYSIYESPFEELENFHNLYLKDFSGANIAELQTIESSFRASLEFQTTLIEMICKIEESKKSQGKVYIPSQDYFDVVGSFFEINQEHLFLLESMPTLETGDFNQIQTRLADDPLNYNLFQTFKIKTPKGKFLYLSPCSHIDVLYSFAYHLIKNAESKHVIEKLLQENAHRRLQKTCRRFFTVRGGLTGLYGTKSRKNLLKKVDFAGVTDRGKILLFKLLPIDISKEVDQQLIEAISDVQGIIKELKEGDLIGLRYADDPQKIPAVPTSIAEIFTIYVIPRLILEPLVLKYPKILSDENVFIIILGVTFPRL